MKISKTLKKFTHEEVLGDAFVVRVTESRVDFETKNKMWKTVFASNTLVYSYVIYLITNKLFEELHARVAVIYRCHQVALNAEMLKAVNNTLIRITKKQAKEAAKKAPEEETEEEILQSERMLHESIEELANGEKK